MGAAQLRGTPPGRRHDAARASPLEKLGRPQRVSAGRIANCGFNAKLITILRALRWWVPNRLERGGPPWPESRRITPIHLNIRRRIARFITTRTIATTEERSSRNTDCRELAASSAAKFASGSDSRSWTEQELPLARPPGLIIGVCWLRAPIPESRGSGCSRGRLASL